ncbi:50S ribosomal protein L6 [bacterium]|nr:50S ribosomal protein L6 [bacterium]
MSRVGNKPIQIPSGVEVSTAENLFTVKGPKGQLECTIPPAVRYQIEDGVITFKRDGDRPQQRADHGLARALVNNLVVGVTEGFSKNLELTGTGYKWEVQGKDVVLNVGFSHPVRLPIPEGISVDIKGIRCEVAGIDKQKVGFMAAQIRGTKPVEPYKGKGIHYVGEFIRRKAGKSGV